MPRLFRASLALLLFTISLGAQSADPQLDANGIYHLGNGIVVPQCIHKALPETTEAASTASSPPSSKASPSPSN